MNFRSPLASCGCGGSLVEPPACASAGFSVRSPRVAPGRKPPGNLRGSLLERSRRGEESRLSWRTERPHPGSGRPRGAAPGARAKAHSGSARSTARPPRASGALRPARGEAAPPRRACFRQIDGRPRTGSTAPTGPRSHGRAPGLSDAGAALVSLPPPPGGMRVVGTCSRLFPASPGDRSQPSFRRSQWTRAPAGIRTVQAPRRRARAGFLSCPPAEPPPPSPYLRKHCRGCQLILPLPRPPFFRSPPSISLISSCQKLQGKDGHERTS